MTLAVSPWIKVEKKDKITPWLVWWKSSSRGIFSSKSNQNNYSYISAVLVILGSKRSHKPIPLLYGYGGDDLQKALLERIKTVQKEKFKEEMQRLIVCRHMRPSSRLKYLTPFVDKSGVVRVGGRLEHALLLYEANVRLYFSWINTRRQI